MENFEINMLLERAIDITNTSAFKNKKVKRLLNVVLMVVASHGDENIREKYNVVFDALMQSGYYGKTEQEPYNN